MPLDRQGIVEKICYFVLRMGLNVHYLGLKKNESVLLAHEVRVELFLLLANQPLFYVHKADINLLKVKGDQYNWSKEKANLYLLRRIKWRYERMVLQWYLFKSQVESLFQNFVDQNVGN